MCGRTCCTLHPLRLARFSAADAFHPALLSYRPKWNFTPTSFIPIAFQNKDSQRVLTTAKWGLIPSFAKEPSEMPYKTINARTDRLTKNGLYKRLLNSHRCVLMVDGFYEWEQKSKPAKGERKKAYYFHLKPSVKNQDLSRAKKEAGSHHDLKDELLDIAELENAIAKSSDLNERFKEELTADSQSECRPLFLAGLHDTWRGDDETIQSVTILTTNAVAPMTDIHSRMPVVLDAKGAEKWLTSDEEPEAVIAQVEKVAKHSMSDLLEYYQVSSDVNTIGNDRADLILPVEKAEEKSGQIKLKVEKKRPGSAAVKKESKKQRV